MDMTLKTSPCLRSQKYMEWIRNQDCLVRGCLAGGVVAHHVRLGQNGGTGLKPSDYRCIPLCDSHHKDLHQNGEKSFLEEIGDGEEDYTGYISDLLMEYWVETAAVPDQKIILTIEKHLNEEGL